VIPMTAEVLKRTAITEKEVRNTEGSGMSAEVLLNYEDKTKSEGQELRLMDLVVARENLWQAYRRVTSNDGAAGIDGMRCQDLEKHLKLHWSKIKEKLLSGSYVPQAVRKVEIPKPNGGTRTLGIPTVMDRFIQQALNQVLQPIFEPEFSESSYGFRPGRSAQQAVKTAQHYIQEGRRHVVDIDLEKFFDKVNHEILMKEVAKKVKDTRVLKLIRRYLRAGMMEGGISSARTEGTPQGGPLSPLLSNILLNNLDQELERRGHKFCRYADDCNIYVKTEQSGKRVMASIKKYLESKLKLKVNAQKSAVARPWERKFLGYSVTREKTPRLTVSTESQKRLRDKIREIMRIGRGRSLWQTIQLLNPLLRGWMEYFKLNEPKTKIEELDGWIRRKLRCLLWRQWKRPNTRQKKLEGFGIAKERAWKSANNGRGAWWNAGASHMNAAIPKQLFDRLGLISLLDTQRRFQRMA
jgi:RNA-directed DNA polymerase